MKILAVSKYSYEGPSSRYRFYNYQKCFASHGLDMTIKPLFGKPYFTTKSRYKKILIVLQSYLMRVLTVFTILFSKNRYDVVLLEYELLPYFPAIFEYLLKKRGVKYIVDYDDAIFHKYDMSTNPVIKLLLKNKIASVIKNASYCIACNKYLENYIKKYNENIYRLPTVVLLDKYKKEMENYQKKEDDKFIVGWIGSRTTSVYILELLEVFSALVQKYPNIAFNLVGFDKELLTEEQIKKHHLHIIPWTEENEIKNILDFDIGIMPLHNDPWSKGKCGFKLVQYMSCKKPVIASPVGINTRLVKDRENGYLVDSRDEWFEALENLYLDKNLREKMSLNNFEKILNEFNFDDNCKKYIILLEKLKV